MSERLSEERLSELEVARKDARWAPQRRWWAEGDRVYINAGLGTYLLAEFSHASDAEYAVTSVNAVDDLLTEVRELRRQLAESQEDGLWCPRCGIVFHDSDVEAKPEQFWTCPFCAAVQHKSCRGPVSDDCELTSLIAERDQLRGQLAVLVARLQEMVDAADCETCADKSPTGCAGELCSITHIKRQLATLPASANQMLERERRMVEALDWYRDRSNYMTEIDPRSGRELEQEPVLKDSGRRASDAIANLPALATARLERVQAMQSALEWYADEDNYAGVGQNDYVARSRIGWDGGLRAREALRPGAPDTVEVSAYLEGRVVTEARRFVEWAVRATREGNEPCSFDLSECADLINALEAINESIPSDLASCDPRSAG